MIEEIKKEISDDQEVLNILPQNNVNNRKKYRNKLKELLEKYTKKQDEVYAYIVSKNSLLKNKYDIEYTDSLKDEEKNIAESEEK